MIIDFCFGIVPLRKVKTQVAQLGFNSSWEVLLVEHKKNFWGFPKGHALDKRETPQQIAERELFEETGLKVESFLQLPALVENYYFKENAQKFHKYVTYFLAEVGGKLRCCKEEIRDGKWLSFDQAIALITFDQARKICNEANEMLFLLEGLVKETFPM